MNMTNSLQVDDKLANQLKDNQKFNELTNSLSDHFDQISDGFVIFLMGASTCMLGSISI